MLGDRSSVVREINSVGEGKLRAFLGDFVEILLRNPEKLMNRYFLQQVQR